MLWMLIYCWCRCSCCCSCSYCWSCGWCYSSCCKCSCNCGSSSSWSCSYICCSRRAAFVVASAVYAAGALVVVGDIGGIDVTDCINVLLVRQLRKCTQKTAPISTPIFNPIPRKAVSINSDFGVNQTLKAVRFQTYLI